MRVNLRELAKGIKFRESKLAHHYLDGLKGIEIGGAAHNPFGLNTINIDIKEDSKFKRREKAVSGEVMKVDVVTSGDNLPFEDKSYDFVISSHVIEHFYDPIKALLEWKRVAKKYIFIIAPHKARNFDVSRPLTTLQELINRHKEKTPKPQSGFIDRHHDEGGKTPHWSVWDTKQFLELCRYLDFNIIEYQDVDDKVGNGFTILIKL